MILGRTGPKERWEFRWVPPAQRFPEATHFSACPCFKNKNKCTRWFSAKGELPVNSIGLVNVSEQDLGTQDFYTVGYSHSRDPPRRPRDDRDDRDGRQVESV